MALLGQKVGTKKQQRATEVLESSSPHAEPFLSYIPYICAERGVKEPTTAGERERLLQSIGEMNSVKSLGPVVKLMRFYSFFQNEKFYHGEVWMTKFLMLEGSKYTVTDGADWVKTETSDTSMSIPDGPKATDREQLQKLKSTHGSWALAPLLVTPESFWQKNAIVVLAKACWSAHAWMSENLLTPAQCAEYTISQSQGGWKNEVLQLVLDGFLSTTTLKKLYPFQSTSESTKKFRLGIHFDFLVTLMAKRASSLASQFLRPPLRYSALASSNEDQVKDAQIKMLDEWNLLLEAEQKDLEGTHVRALDSLQFLNGAVCRLAFLLNEQDCHCHSHEASILIRSLITNFMDTLCVENTHQSAKDCLRDSRHNVRSRVHKMGAVIDSRLFQTRKTNHVAVSEVEVSLASPKGLPAFAPLTHPNSHYMQSQFQKMMLYKSGDHWWPSTSAATQFEEVAALEQVLSSSDAHQQLHLNCLAGPPGTLIASSSKGVVCIVLCKAPSGVLTWTVEPLGGGEGATYKCIAQATALQFHHISTLDEWVEIPCQPVLQHDHGCLLLAKNGPEMSLPLARVKQGLTMTVKECKEVLAACDIKLPGQPSKAEVYKAVVGQFITDPAEAQEALAKTNVNMDEQNDEADSELADYQDLVDLVEEDAENRGDPDIKAEQKKVQKKKDEQTQGKSQSCQP
jgi:hypothetical protein